MLLRAAGIIVPARNPSGRFLVDNGAVCSRKRGQRRGYFYWVPSFLASPRQCVSPTMPRKRIQRSLRKPLQQQSQTKNRAEAAGGLILQILTRSAGKKFLFLKLGDARLWPGKSLCGRGSSEVCVCPRPRQQREHEAVPGLCWSLIAASSPGISLGIFNFSGSTGNSSGLQSLLSCRKRGRIRHLRALTAPGCAQVSPGIPEAGTSPGRAAAGFCCGPWAGRANQGVSFPKNDSPALQEFCREALGSQNQGILE